MNSKASNNLTSSKILIWIVILSILKIFPMQCTANNMKLIKIVSTIHTILLKSIAPIRNFTRPLVIWLILLNTRKKTGNTSMIFAHLKSTCKTRLVKHSRVLVMLPSTMKKKKLVNLVASLSTPGNWMPKTSSPSFVTAFINLMHPIFNVNITWWWTTWSWNIWWRFKMSKMTVFTRNCTKKKPRARVLQIQVLLIHGLKIKRLWSVLWDAKTTKQMPENVWKLSTTMSGKNKIEHVLLLWLLRILNTESHVTMPSPPWRASKLCQLLIIQTLSAVTALLIWALIGFTSTIGKKKKILYFSQFKRLKNILKIKSLKRTAKNTLPIQKKSNPKFVSIFATLKSIQMIWNTKMFDPIRNIKLTTRQTLTRTFLLMLPWKWNVWSHWRLIHQSTMPRKLKTLPWNMVWLQMITNLPHLSWTEKSLPICFTRSIIVKMFKVNQQPIQVLHTKCLLKWQREIPTSSLTPSTKRRDARPWNVTNIPSNNILKWSRQDWLHSLAMMLSTRRANNKLLKNSRNG